MARIGSTCLRIRFMIVQQFDSGLDSLTVWLWRSGGLAQDQQRGENRSRQQPVVRRWVTRGFQLLDPKNWRALTTRLNIFRQQNITNRTRGTHEPLRRPSNTAKRNASHRTIQAWILRRLGFTNAPPVAGMANARTQRRRASAQQMQTGCATRRPLK